MQGKWKLIVLAGLGYIAVAGATDLTIHLFDRGQDAVRVSSGHRQVT
jgi:hypothetical protein